VLFCIARYRADVDQRALSRIDEQTSVTQSDRVTKPLKLGRPTIRKDGVPLTGAARQAKHRARKGRSINRHRPALYKQQKQGDEAQQRRERSRNAPPLPDGVELRIGDCRVALADILDNSVALILTDPPYGKDAEPLYEWLAKFAARVLIPGGSLICYTGQTNLLRDGVAGTATWGRITAGMGRHWFGADKLKAASNASLRKNGWSAP